MSRWEASVARPSVQISESLMRLLNASPDERNCYGLSGVAKIKSERPLFEASSYDLELELLEQRLAQGDSEGCELRLLQIQSNLWWSLSEPKAPELMRRSRVLFAELLVSDQRLSDAELHAEAALEASKDAYDHWGVRAQRIIARVETYRGPVPRPHVGLLILQRCLQESKDESSRCLVLHDLAELSLEGRRIEEALGYARRALAASLKTFAPESKLVASIEQLLERSETSQNAIELVLS